MFVTTNKKLGFIHIPKCGGSSISSAFRHGEKGPNKNNHQDPWSPWYPCDTHAHYSKIQRANIELPETWFTTVRNPFQDITVGTIIKLLGIKSGSMANLNLKHCQYKKCNSKLTY